MIQNPFWARLTKYIFLPPLFFHGYLIHLTDPYSCEWQNQSFVSNKYVSQAIYKTLQTKKMNFEKNS